MANAAALRVRPGDLASLWGPDDVPDLVLDADDGALRPVRPARENAGPSLASGIGKAVATAAPVAADVVLSSVSRWD